jgi:hypothetical protein
VRSGAALPQLFFHGGEEQGNHDLMVADEIKALPAELGWPSLHILRRAIVARHVKGRGCKAFHLVAEIPRDGECLEEDFGHDHRAPDIEDDAAFELRHDRGERLEIAIAGLAEHRAVGRRVLVRDVGADGHVHGDGKVEFSGGGEQTEVAIRKRSRRLAQRAPGAEAARDAFGQGGVHSAARFIDHAEASIVEPALHILARLALIAELEVVDRSGAVEGNGMEQARAHRIDENWIEPYLD